MASDKVPFLDLLMSCGLGGSWRPLRYKKEKSIARAAKGKQSAQGIPNDTKQTSNAVNDNPFYLNLLMELAGQAITNAVSEFHFLNGGKETAKNGTIL